MSPRWAARVPGEPRDHDPERVQNERLARNRSTERGLLVEVIVWAGWTARRNSAAAAAGEPSRKPGWLTAEAAGAAEKGECVMFTTFSKERGAGERSVGISTARAVMVV